MSTRTLEVGCAVRVGSGAHARVAIVEGVKYNGTRAQLHGRWVAAHVLTVVASAAEVAALERARAARAARQLDRLTARALDAIARLEADYLRSADALDARAALSAEGRAT